MATLGPVPDYIREAFRCDLIERRGSSVAFGLGYWEELRRFEFYLNIVEEFISQQEKAEIAALQQDPRTYPGKGKANSGHAITLFIGTRSSAPI